MILNNFEWEGSGLDWAVVGCCGACLLHYWWIFWWPEHICGSISIISISVISLLPNGVIRPPDWRSSIGSSLLCSGGGEDCRGAVVILWFCPISRLWTITVLLSAQNWYFWHNIVFLYKMIWGGLLHILMGTLNKPIWTLFKGKICEQPMAVIV